MVRRMAMNDMDPCLVNSFMCKLYKGRVNIKAPVSTPVDGQDDDVAILFVLFDLFFQLSYRFTGLIELKDVNSFSVWLCLPRIWNTPRIVSGGKHQHPGITFKPMAEKQLVMLPQKNCALLLQTLSQHREGCP